MKQASVIEKNRLKQTIFKNQIPLLILAQIEFIRLSSKHQVKVTSNTIKNTLSK